MFPEIATAFCGGDLSFHKNPLYIPAKMCYTIYTRAIPHKDCATDASSNFSSDETKSGVNTGCIHEHFCEIWESVSYLTYADCVVRFFERWREKRRKSFVDFRVFSRNISENMHARCVREDTKQALKGNLQADGVQSRQTLFVRYCPNTLLNNCNRSIITYC